MTITTLTEIIEQSTAVAVYFQNDHCPPCVSLRPKIHHLFENNFPKIKVLFLNSMENPLLTAHFSVFSHPTLLIFFEGKEYFRGSKYISIEELKTKIARPYQLIFS